MKVLAIAAVAATFWLIVATIRLVLHGDCADRSLDPSQLPHVEVSTPRHAGECSCDGSDDCLGELKPPRHREYDDPFSGRDGGPMSKAALVKGLNDVRPLVGACYAKYQVPGTAMVNVVIAKSGKVTSAVVTGRFAGTPTGACVERAVRTARFPPSDGFSAPYPFQLKGS
jgi:hypothetical protein